MSNSPRAKERRHKRSKLNKHQRDLMAKQHFGDKYTFKGRRLMKGEDKQELIEKRKRDIIDLQADLRERFREVKDDN